MTFLHGISGCASRKGSLTRLAASPLTCACRSTESEALPHHQYSANRLLVFHPKPADIDATADGTAFSILPIPSHRVLAPLLGCVHKGVHHAASDVVDTKVHDAV